MPRVRLPPGLQLALALAASCVLAACPGGDDPLPDGPATDGGGDSRGLVVVFATNAPIPVTAGVATISEVVLDASSIRAIGDAAPGDDRTTRLDTRLRWREDEIPEPVGFAAAPVGLYSTIALRLAGDQNETAFRLTGETMRQGDRVDFDIESHAALDLTIAIDAMLAPGGDLTVRLSLDVGALVAPIDWDGEPVDGGRIEISDASPVMAEIIAALRIAITPTP